MWYSLDQCQTKSRCLWSGLRCSKTMWFFELMALVGIKVVEEECDDWDTGFLIDDNISEMDLDIKELCSEDKDEEMPAQTL